MSTKYIDGFVFNPAKCFLGIMTEKPPDATTL